MRLFFRLGYSSIVMAMILWAAALQAKEQGDQVTAVRDSLKRHAPQLKVESISVSPIKGMYEVIAGPMVLYVSQDGRYAFSGDIIDLENGQNNITEQSRKHARLAGLQALGKNSNIIFGPKNPQYTVVVFTDVDCGYCRKLQTEMPEINAKGIAIRYLAFPRAGLNSPTFEKMVRIWCAKDKQKAMTLAQEDKPFEGEACDNKTVQREFEYGVQIGVSGTPTLLFEDGTMIPGYLSPDELLKAAQRFQKKNDTQ